MNNPWMELPGAGALDLRKAFGTFMTGVTVVTTRLADGQIRAFTANSFTSVSLDPALVLVCILKNAASLENFSNAADYSISVLADHQWEVSNAFASRDPAVKTGAVSYLTQNAIPHVEGCLSVLVCTTHQLIDAGDHVILLGRVKRFQSKEGSALGFFRGKYIQINGECPKESPTLRCARA